LDMVFAVGLARSDGTCAVKAKLRGPVPAANGEVAGPAVKVPVSATAARLRNRAGALINVVQNNVCKRSGLPVGLVVVYYWSSP